MRPNQLQWCPHPIECLRVVVANRYVELAFERGARIYQLYLTMASGSLLLEARKHDIMPAPP